MGTRKATRQASAKLTASVADLACVVRLDLDYTNPYSFSLVLDEKLQLEERPVANPIVHNLAPSLFSYSFEVFHYNLVSIKVGNNVFTDVVVNPSHVTSFSARQLLEKPCAGPCAFGLKNRTQVFELSFDLFDFTGMVEPAVRADGEVVYSEVNAQNNVLRSVVLLSGIYLFRESEQEETPSFTIHAQEAFINFPGEVFFVTIRDVKAEFLPCLEQSQNKDISFEIGTSREVIPDRSSVDDWLELSLLNHCTCLNDTANSELGWQFEPLPKSGIDDSMQVEVGSNFGFPGFINTELQSSGVCLDSSNKFFGWVDSDFGSNYASHDECGSVDIYKLFGGESSRRNADYD